MEKFTGNKIIVLGCSGSGKSTFSRKLAARTGLPLIHLDNIWWRPDQTHITREEFDQKLNEILHDDFWIIDGNYSRTYEERIRACDAIIFLDYSEEVCMDGITRRVGQNRPDIPWTEQHLNPELVKFVHAFHETGRSPLLALIEKYSDKKALIFKTREEAGKWLSQTFLACHPTTEEEKYRINAWNYTGDYAIYNNPPYEEQKKRGFGFANPQNNFYSFYDGTSLVGFVNLSEEENEVFFGIGVNPDCCNHGYGQQMTRIACELSQTLFPGKPLYLEVRTWNTRAVRCYEKAGFCITGEPILQKTSLGEGLFYRMSRGE